MRKILLATVAILSATSAFAADLPRKSNPVMPVAMPMATPMWQGFYLGAQAGWFQGNATFKDPGFIDDKYSKNGAKIGAFAGYNWQFGNVVAGVEGDLGVAFDKKTKRGTVAGIPFSTSVENNLDGSARLRAGYLVTPSVLLYATGGLAFGEVKAKEAVGAWSYSEGKTRTGYTLGGGVETMLGRNWLARVEYRYTDFGSKSYGTAPTTVKLNDTTNQVNLGLGYKF